MFIHLHLHTDGSDGTGTPERVIARAKQLGQPAVAITDHGTLANIIAFSSEAKLNGIKPIIGQEIYFYDGDDGKVRHMTTLAKNREGIENLYRLTTIAAKSVTKKPTVTKFDLFKHAKGLILMSGCPASPIFHKSGMALNSFVGELVDSFGEDFYLEAPLVSPMNPFVKLDEIRKQWPRLKVVATSDVHFVMANDAKVQSIANSCRFGFSFENTGLWMKSEAEMVLAASVLGIGQECIHQSEEIASRIEAPNLSVTSGIEFPNAIETLKDIVRRQLKATLIGVPESEARIRIARAKHELNTIIGKGYADYFMIVHDIVNWAKSNGVSVGPGRGSAAGSYVLHLLGITELDPLEWNLSFERFLNPIRVDMPDVDIDFSMATRGKLLEYVANRWNGIPIATYSRFSHKMLVHDLSKFLGIPVNIDKKAADDSSSDEFLGLMAKPDFSHAYNVLNGTIRHRGKHASGMVITSSVVPIERMGDTAGIPWTEGDHKELSQIGLIKFDLLGLSAVSALDRMKEISGAEPDEFGNDPATMQLFCEGKLLGIFQFSGSAGIVALTKKIAPSTAEDLIAINALWRPGALDVGSTQKYPEWKKSPRKLHPRLDPILAPTYGAIVYQEQVMEIYATVTGGDISEADLARRVIVKSKVGDPAWEKQIEETMRHFMENGLKNGFEEPLLRSVWGELFSHARYSFNRAHSASYSLIAYKMAYYKANYPQAFYVAMLEYDEGNSMAYIYEATMNGIEFHAPHVNSAIDRYGFSEGKITLPLGAVNSLGATGVTTIINSRRVNGPFTSIEDFASRIPKRICNSSARRYLLITGAFKGIEGSVASLGANLDELPKIGSDDAIAEGLRWALPSPALIANVERLRERDTKSVIGMISGIRKKEREKGTVWFYDVYPDGFFWAPIELSVKVGNVVKVSLYGKKAKRVELL